MHWIQIIFSCTREQSEQLESALWELGAISITYQDAADQPLLEPGVGEMPLWDQVQFSALFDAGIETGTVLQQLASQLDFPLPDNRIELVEKKDWERAWMEHYHAMSFGKRLWICPSWQQPPEPKAINLMLDPGLAFGTGTHQTTALCLKWLDSQNLVGKKVLDYGCGSGVLAVAALLLGADSALGVDNDPQALLASRDNARRNGCESRMAVRLADTAEAIEAVDIVMANILAAPLVELAPVLLSALKPGGLLVMSGLLQEQAEQVMDAYKPEVNFETPVEFDGWIRLEGQRQTG